MMFLFLPSNFSLIFAVAVIIIIAYSIHSCILRCICAVHAVCYAVLCAVCEIFVPFSFSFIFLNNLNSCWIKRNGYFIVAFRQSKFQIIWTELWAREERSRNTHTPMIFWRIFEFIHTYIFIECFQTFRRLCFVMQFRLRFSLLVFFFLSTFSFHCYVVAVVQFCIVFLYGFFFLLRSFDFAFFCHFWCIQFLCRYVYICMHACIYVRDDCML